jgi:hypothetical protein
VRAVSEIAQCGLAISLKEGDNHMAVIATLRSVEETHVSAAHPTGWRNSSPLLLAAVRKPSKSGGLKTADTKATHGH